METAGTDENDGEGLAGDEAQQQRATEVQHQQQEGGQRQASDGDVGDEENCQARVQAAQSPNDASSPAAAPTSNNSTEAAAKAITNWFNQEEAMVLDRIEAIHTGERSRNRVPKVIDAKGSNSLTMSALTTSATSTASGLPCTDMETKAAAIHQPTLREGVNSDPVHLVDAEHENEEVPSEPELVVARRVNSSIATSTQEDSTPTARVVSGNTLSGGVGPDQELVLVRASRAKVEDSLRDLLKSRRGLCLIAAFIIVIVLVAAGIAIGVEGSNRRRDDDDNNDINSDNESISSEVFQTHVPSHSPTLRPSISPSVQPTTVPTLRPSTASPTTDLEGYLVANDMLPNYTIAALRNASSPQAKALRWLDDAHSEETLRNLTAQDRILQRYALAVFYYSTNGFGWLFNRYWLSDVNECEWWSHLEVAGASTSDGLQTVCNEDGHYLGLLLDNNILQGSLPPQVALLTHLEDISLVADSFGVSKEDKKSRFLIGGIPSQYGLLTHLRDLDLAKNALSSTIPSEIGLLSDSLDALRLLENNMTGSLPTQLAYLTTVRRLYVYDNSFTGTLPSELGQLTQLLLDFNAIKNQFTGTLPSEYGLLTQLTALSLQENQLVSSVPSQYGNLTTLRWLLLKHNKLTGTLPPVGNLRELRLFYVEYNMFTGTIPTSYGGMLRVTDIGFNNNKLTGTIPSELGLLTRLIFMDLTSNMLTGIMPNEICTLPTSGLRFSVSVDCEEVECDCGCCTGCCK